MPSAQGWVEASQVETDTSFLSARVFFILLIVCMFWLLSMMFKDAISAFPLFFAVFVYVHVDVRMQLLSERWD